MPPTRLQELQRILAQHPDAAKNLGVLLNVAPALIQAAAAASTPLGLSMEQWCQIDSAKNLPEGLYIYETKDATLAAENIALAAARHTAKAMTTFRSSESLHHAQEPLRLKSM